MPLGELKEVPDKVRSPSAPAGGLMKERAYEQIKSKILRGDYAARSFLTERQLALQMGMSKTPVRAALERLEQDGFVTISPQQGIVVREMSVHEIADHFEMRAALETYVVRSLAGHLSAKQVEQLLANLKAHEDVSTNGDTERGVALDMEFHILFCQFLDNQEILRVMLQLRDKIFRVISRVLQIYPVRFGEASAEHRSIAEAVIAGDADLAAQRVVEHLERGKHYLISPRRP